MSLEIEITMQLLSTYRPLIKLQKFDTMIGLKETIKFKLSKILNT